MQMVLDEARQHPGRLDQIGLSMPGDPYPYQIYLDVDVASTVMALAALGAVMTTSCNAGHLGGRHFESRILVGFFAPKNLALILSRAAHTSNVVFGLVDIDLGAVKVVYAENLENMMAFAEALWNEPNRTLISAR